MDHSCSARGRGFGWMSTLLSRAGAQAQICVEHTANWRVDAGSDGQQVGLERTDCSLIVDQTMGSQKHSLCVCAGSLDTHRNGAVAKGAFIASKTCQVLAVFVEPNLTIIA